MKLSRNFIIALMIPFFIQSCASYKPAVYDTNTSSYHNYEKNYSINIIDGYALLSAEETEKVRKSFFPKSIADTALFYDDKNEAMLGLFSMKDVGYIAPKQKLMVLGAISGAVLQSGKDCKECQDVTAVSSEDDITVNMHISNDEGDSDVVMKLVPYPQSKTSEKNNLLMFMVASDQKSGFDKAKNDFLKMYDTLELTAFYDDERLLQE